MFIDGISAVSSVQVIFHSNLRPQVSRASFEGRITGARRPITVVVAIVGMDWFKTTEKNSIFTKDNMHAFHPGPFKSGPLP